MKKVIYISPIALWTALGLVTAAIVAAVVVELPEIRRYVKAATM